MKIRSYRFLFVYNIISLEEFDFLPYYFAQQKVSQATCSNPEPLVCKPLFTKNFFYNCVVNQSICHGV